MTTAWSSYAAADFVPFSSEVYHRLIERMNEALWPWHLIWILAIPVLWRLPSARRVRIVGVMFAASWMWVGTAFHLRRYAELMWAATWFGRFFWVQGVLLLVLAFRGMDEGRGAVSQWMGRTLLTFGLLLYPLLSAFWGEGPGWSGAESFGMHPDPTVVATLGLLMCATTGWRLWAAGLIPVLWCVVGGMTLRVLADPMAVVPFGAAVLFAAGATWKTWSFRKRDGSEKWLPN